MFVSCLECGCLCSSVESLIDVFNQCAVRLWNLDEGVSLECDLEKCILFSVFSLLSLLPGGFYSILIVCYPISALFPASHGLKHEYKISSITLWFGVHFPSNRKLSKTSISGKFNRSLQ